MAILRELRYKPVSEWGSPFSFRPNSQLALAADPGDEAGHARSLSLFFEIVAPGDAGALHRHTSDEAIFIEDGHLEIRIGERIEVIGPDDVAFVPQGTPHAWRNPGPEPIRFRAVFPTDVVEMQLVEDGESDGIGEGPSQIDVRAVLRDGTR